MPMLSLADISSFFRGHVLVDEPMERYTWMRVGGKADLYLEPADRDDLIALIKRLRASGTPFLMLGRGSNVLVSDAGIRGAVINIETCLSEIRSEGGVVIAEAGVRLTKFVDFCVTRGLSGVEMLAGIPGTIGGAIVMNAGAHGGETADHVLDVDVLRGDAVVRVAKVQAGFGYRRSGFGGDIVLSARFSLPKGNAEELARKRRDLILRRNQTQPLELPNLGSMFKNPPGMFAAKLIEECGLKGAQVGRAQVSEKHANFMVNLGGATAADLLELIRKVRATVKERNNVKLELEVKLVGFTDDERASVA
jgi:UDP-N-acetylmuramate dehydrogenase